jgi:hypothetical protein
VSALVTWRVIAHQAPSPEEDPHFRGLGVLAVPGDLVAVSTPDGVITGEPSQELPPDASGFLLLTADGEVYGVSPRAVTWLDW